ncbi:hypothetical protein [Mycobacterium sp. 94-17]|nr:hypothetical protein [Mycobacterium sp. 94-17]MEB4207726.1 hypothetical protein [Mycobacterium sp. 94-17]
MRTKSTKKMLKAAALIAVLTGVMLGSSGCITIGAPAAVEKSL